MSTFTRSFPIERLTSETLKGSPWFRDLLRYWRPAGDLLPRGAATTPTCDSTEDILKDDSEHLRLAVRHDYLNFYRAGQSVGKVNFGRGGSLESEIHNKYVYGSRGSGNDRVRLTSQGFPDVVSGQFCKYDGNRHLREWISNASAYVDKEKSFVDLVVGWNSNVIDLEIALPVDRLVSGDRGAPRLDLVALEPLGGAWRIVFWEAKLVDNGDARCAAANAPPKVAHQLAKYTKWLGDQGNSNRVAAGYQQTCRLLVSFHELAKQVNPRITDLAPAIVAVAARDAAPLLLDPKPRLIIDARTSSGSFVANGHLAKLRGPLCGIHVQMVGVGDGFALDTLP